MDIDLLRRAADKLRTCANRAPEGPWVSLDNGDRLVALRENHEHFPNGFRYLVDEPIDDTSIAEYFALMHPPVASALADLLDAAAKDIEAVTAVRLSAFLDEQAAAVAMAKRRHQHAVAVARAVLREDGS